MSSSPNARRRVAESPEREKEQAQRIEEAQRRAAQGQKRRFSKESIFDKYQYHLVFGAFGLLCLFALGSFLMTDRRKLNTVPVLDDDEIEAFNNQNSDFTVGRNDFFEGWKMSDVKGVLRNSLSSKPTLPRCMTAEDTSIIPDKYNFRTAKPECTAPIFNQGNCSSSYAIAATSTLSDRLCFQSGGKINTRLAAQHVLSCDKSNYGCKGGAVNQVFEFGKKEGFADEKCLPYQPDEKLECPASVNECNKEKVLDYCVTNGEEGLKREIYKNGPIVAILPIYKDFLIYKKGVYNLIEGTPRFQGGQIVKVIGWDQDENTQQGYWIVENSWGESWGVNGLAHVGFGQKQLLIEEFALAVTPFIEGQEQQETASSDAEVKATEEDIKPEVVDLDG